METVDYGDTDLRSVIEGDRHSREEESFAKAWIYTAGVRKVEELVDIEEEDDEDVDDDYLEFDETLGDEE